MWRKILPQKSYLKNVQNFFFAFLNSLDPRNQGGTLLSWLRPSRGSWGPISNLAGNSNFLDFFTKPNNMGVYGLPWTSATKIWHFWADSGPLEGPGVQFYVWWEIQIFLDFFTKPNNMGVYWLSWTSATKASHFWADSNPPEGPRVPFQIWREIQFFLISSQNQTKWVSTDSPRPCQPRFKILELT